MTTARGDAGAQRAASFASTCSGKEGGSAARPEDWVVQLTPETVVGREAAAALYAHAATERDKCIHGGDAELHGGVGMVVVRRTLGSSSTAASMSSAADNPTYASSSSTIATLADSVHVSDAHAKLAPSAWLLRRPLVPAAPAGAVVAVCQQRLAAQLRAAPSSSSEDDALDDSILGMRAAACGVAEQGCAPPVRAQLVHVGQHKPVRGGPARCARWLPAPLAACARRVLECA